MVVGYTNITPCEFCMIVQSLLAPSSNSISRYACRRSILLKTVLPPMAANISYTLGSGYFSTLIALFTVVWKSPQIWIVPSFFGTTTIRVAHSLLATGVIMPSFSSLSRSSATLSFKLGGVNWLTVQLDEKGQQLSSHLGNLKTVRDLLQKVISEQHLHSLLILDDIWTYKLAVVT